MPINWGTFSQKAREELQKMPRGTDTREAMLFNRTAEDDPYAFLKQILHEAAKISLAQSNIDRNSYVPKTTGSDEWCRAVALNLLTTIVEANNSEGANQTGAATSAATSAGTPIDIFLATLMVLEPKVFHPAPFPVWMQVVGEATTEEAQSMLPVLIFSESDQKEVEKAVERRAAAYFANAHLLINAKTDEERAEAERQLEKAQVQAEFESAQARRIKPGPYLDITPKRKLKIQGIGACACYSPDKRYIWMVYDTGQNKKVIQRVPLSSGLCEMPHDRLVPYCNAWELDKSIMPVKMAVLAEKDGSTRLLLWGTLNAFFSRTAADSMWRVNLTPGSKTEYQGWPLVETTKISLLGLQVCAFGEQVILYDEQQFDLVQFNGQKFQRVRQISVTGSKIRTITAIESETGTQAIEVVGDNDKKKNFSFTSYATQLDLS